VDTTAETTVGGDGEVEDLGGGGRLLLRLDVLEELWGKLGSEQWYAVERVGVRSSRSE
jgi:hypothetical protein